MAVALSLSVLAALCGQWLLAEREHVTIGVGCFAMAVVLFLVPFLRSSVDLSGVQRPVEAPGSWAPLFRSRFWRLFFLVTALVLAFLAFRGFAGNRLAGGFWFWLGALFYFVIAFGERPAGGWLLLIRRTWERIDRRTLLAVAAITGLGILFRLYRLSSVPAEMTSDHAEKLLDVYDVLSGRRPIFFPRNTGREMIQFYLTAALIRFTPLTIGHLALKVGTALFGIVTVPLTFLLGKELYGRKVGLLAAFFLAVSHWHVAITRVGLRFPFTAAFAVPALYLLVRALKRNGRNDWLAAGLILGIGLHTYTAMRIVPLLLLLLVGVKVGGDLVSRRWAARRSPDQARATSLDDSFWLNAVLGGLAAALAFLPLLRFMLDEPGLFWFRAASRAGQTLSFAATWRTFWGNVQDALLMFNYRGDVVPANTIPEAPELGLVSGALFVPGVV
ncbi:MAG: glycosyltransferase family 39 protein, partial [Candidatus Promineifilaceae bacterium]|nr:glycosyltransferase family 39 protein [Candidatus Promineifilaceae bacterium]